MPMRFVDRIRERVGEEIYVSDWFEITQVDVDVFAAVTRDWDYMHNDPEWAAEKGPWPTTIAHGFYLLSLVSHFQSDAGFPTVATEDEYLVNYGLDKVRFVEPVRIGDRLRARLSITDVQPRKPGRELVRSQIVFETERCGERPHMIAEALTLSVYGEAFADAR
jgi:acyl dehydratase